MIDPLSINAHVLIIAGETDTEKGLQKGIDAKDSVGGAVECRVSGLPIGLGEPFFDSVESLLAHAVFSIPAVRGIEFGTGFKSTELFGSQHNDAIENATGKTVSNHAGGIVGGLTNGNELVSLCRSLSLSVFLSFFLSLCFYLWFHNFSSTLR